MDSQGGVKKVFSPQWASCELTDLSQIIVIVEFIVFVNYECNGMKMNLCMRCI